MHQNEVKLFLVAPTKEEIVEAQLKNNRNHGKGFQYGDPKKEGKNYVVWFMADALEYMKKETGRKK